MSSKEQLRRLHRTRRAALSVEECARASSSICETILSMPFFGQANTVAIYHPLNREVDLRALDDGSKRIVYPRLVSRENKTMEFAVCEKQFRDGVFGLKEPDGPVVLIDEIDIIFVPGLAFDPTGRRIGYGAGYYDLYLKDFHGWIVGVAYDSQIEASLPSDPWDVLMHNIVTERRVLETHSTPGINPAGGSTI